MCMAHMYGTACRLSLSFVLPPFERFQDMLEFVRGKDDTAPACEQRSVA